MHSRRSFLARSAAGTAALAGLSGCLGLLGDDEGDGWSTALADPRPAVSPGFHVAYDCDAATAIDAFGDATPFPTSIGRAVDHEDRGYAALPAAAGRFLDVVDAELDGVERTDLDRATGHYYAQAGITGVSMPVPEGEGLSMTGSLPVGTVTDWLDRIEPAQRLPGADEYARYGIDGPSAEGFAATDDHLAYGSRTEAGTEPADVLDAELADGDENWLREASPGLAAVSRSFDGYDVAVVAAFDLVAERPDTGEAAFDDLVASLEAAGIAATVDGEETTIERTLRYRASTPGVERVEAALDRAAEGVGPVPVLGDDPSISRGDRSVTVTTTVANERVREDPAVLRGLPATGYGDLFVPVVPDDLGRSPPPRVRWTGGVRDDGHVAFEHGSGASVEDVVVRYVSDGEERTEEWDGPVEEGDGFESAEQPDPGTRVEIVWRPGTPDETVLASITVAED